MGIWGIGRARCIGVGVIVALLGIVALSGCSSQTGVTGEPEPSATAVVAESAAVTASDNVPHYYAEFDPNLDPAELFDPCRELSPADLESLGLVPDEDTYSNSPSGRITMCQFLISDGKGGTLRASTTFTLGRDLITQEILKERGLVLFEDDPWLFSNENHLLPTSTCTASIPTVEGRFSVTYFDFNTDPDYQREICATAKEMALKSGELLFNSNRSN